MGGKRKIQRRLVEGAEKGLRSGKLFDYVKEKVPDAPAKKIVRTAFMTLTDSSVLDRKTLDAIYHLAIVYRLSEDVPPPKREKPARKPAGSTS